jgi:mercuric ion binding protein
MIRRVTALIALGLLLSLGSAQAEDAESRTAVFHVEGMTCGLCAKSIDKALRGVDGVRSVEVDREAERVTVVADATLPDDRLEQAIEAAGRYEAERVE